jgi:hypothetical protein
MADSAPGNAAPAGPRPRTRFNPTENAVQRTRAWVGLLVVAGGDALIAGAAIYGVWRLGKDAGQTVAILTSAFTAISTMTAAYFGIRAAANTAQAAQQTAQQSVATMATTATETAGPTAGGPGGPEAGGPEEGGPGGPGSGGPEEGGPGGLGGPEEGGPGGTGVGLTEEPASGATEEPGDGGVPGVGDAGEAATKPDRPVDEPEGATQDDQYQLIRETGNDRQDMTEEEEASVLQDEFGPADHAGIYGAPKGDE